MTAVKIPPALTAFVVIVVTLAEAANVVATLFLHSGDPTMHAVFLAIAAGVGIASKGGPGGPSGPPPAPERPASHRRSDE